MTETESEVETRKSLTVKYSIFIAHPSGHLTDHLANGDGLIAHGVISRLAARGYDLHIAVDNVSLRKPLPTNASLYPLNVRSTNPALHLVEFSIRMRLLFERLRRKHTFALNLQMNPVYPGISLALLGTRVPLILGTYVPRWVSDPSHAKDAYTSSSGFAAKLRDVVVALQQSHADALLLTTPAAHNRVPLLSPESRKLNELPHGVDSEIFFPACDPNISVQAKNKSILFLASVSERKGIFDLLKAFPKVLQQVPDCRLTIVGAGAELDRVKEQALGQPYRDQITFLGSVSREKTPDIYRAHTVYCLPSYGEPYATTLLEAMASGLPIVSTLTGGTPYLVPSAGGRLVAPGDVDSLAMALIEILGSTALQHSMGQENRKTIVERFSWERVIDQLERIYFAVSGGTIGKEFSGSDMHQSYSEV